MKRILQALEVVKPIGWLLLVIGLGTGVIAEVAHWRELAVLSIACLALLVLAGPFLLGRAAVSVDLRLHLARARRALDRVPGPARAGRAVPAGAHGGLRRPAAAARAGRGGGVGRRRR